MTEDSSILVSDTELDYFGLYYYLLFLFSIIYDAQIKSG